VSTSDPTPAPAHTTARIGRRALLGWSGAAGVAGLAAGGAAGTLTHRDGATTAPTTDRLTTDRLAPAGGVVADRSLPMGLGARIPAFGHLVAFDLHGHASGREARETAVAFLRFLARLADQAAAPASYPRVVDAIDPQATGSAGLDLRPASLQVTPGIGASLLTACDLGDQRPAELIDLPAFATDRLDPARCGGDLMVQIGAEDPLKLAGAVQAVVSYARSRLADRLRLRWSRSGFRGTAVAADNPATTGRNLMGHRDGTDNPTLGSPLWRTAVQSRQQGWMEGGSYLVARQILIDLDTWFGHDEAARDRVIGRRTADGAALGDHTESQLVDLGARDAAGALKIPAHAHIRLASPQNTLGARIYRRSWNFDDGYVDGQRHAGLLFLAWQADIRRGFLPIQRALTQHHDALNAFTTHVGSAVFAVPARRDDEYVGQRLLEA
jgi:dye decolorizing peroxidase